MSWSVLFKKLLFLRQRRPSARPGNSAWLSIKKTVISGLLQN